MERFRISSVKRVKARWEDVNNCLNFMELISLYVDGEASENEIKELEAHVKECESCASFLRAYKGISSVIEADEKTPPPSLRTSVMEKIKSDPAPLNSQKADRSRIIRVAFRRYVPLAACLAIIILAMFPIARQFNEKSSSDNMSAAISPSAPAPSGTTGGYAANETETDTTTTAPPPAQPPLTGTGLSPAPNATPAEAANKDTGEFSEENGTVLFNGLGDGAFLYSEIDYYALVKIEGTLPKLLEDRVLFADENDQRYIFIPAEDVETLQALGYGVEYHNEEAATAVVIYIEN